MTLPILDMSTDQGAAAFGACLDHLCATATAEGDPARTVAAIIEDVKQHGDDAVVRYMRQWTDPRFDADRIRVATDELVRAEKSLDLPLRDAIADSIDHVRRYQQHIKPPDPAPITIDGAELGLRFTPVECVGLMVPGGTAVLFSTLIMLAVPAIVAGVDPKRLSVVSPPPTPGPGEEPGDISPIILAACAMLGIETVYRIGGAQAVAAMAFGTQRVRRVDMLAGPGNVFVQLAKAQLAGFVGTDGGFYGPSEIVTIADETADASKVAADLIAQAEHDPGKCFVVSWSRKVIDEIIAQVDRQLVRRDRRDAIESALRDRSAAVLVADEAQAIEITNAIASEHVNLAVADPDALLKQTRHGGGIFLGDQTPVAAGDYYAGPSHCLPTGTTARFASGISVYTFLRRTGTVCYRRGMSAKTIEAIARLAEAEGLDGHAASVRVRRT